MAARAAPIVRGRSFFMRAGTFLPIIGESDQICAYMLPAAKKQMPFLCMGSFYVFSAERALTQAAAAVACTRVCKKRTSIATISCFSSAFSSPLRGF